MSVGRKRGSKETEDSKASLHLSKCLCHQQTATISLNSMFLCVAYDQINFPLKRSNSRFLLVEWRRRRKNKEKQYLRSVYMLFSKRFISHTTQ